MIDTMTGREAHSLPQKIILKGGIISCLSLTLPGKTRMGYFQWRVHRGSGGWNVSWMNGYSNFLLNFTHENRAKSLYWLLYQRLTEWIHVTIHFYRLIGNDILQFLDPDSLFWKLFDPPLISSKITNLAP